MTPKTKNSKSIFTNSGIFASASWNMNPGASINMVQQCMNRIDASAKSLRKVDNFSTNYCLMPDISKTNCINSYDELKEKIKEINNISKKELKQLFVDLLKIQMTNGSINNDKELTSAVLRIYELLHKPIAFRNQCKKAKQFLDN